MSRPSTARWRSSSGLSFLLTLVVASSSVSFGQRGAWSDGAVLMPLDAQVQDLEDRRMDLCTVQVTSSGVPLVSVGGRDLEREIEQAEAELKKRKPGDPSIKVLEALIKQLKALRDATPRSTASSKPTQLSLAGALANIERRLQKNARAYAAFKGSAAAKDLRQADRVAAAALASGQHEGALAALAAAHRLAPKDPGRLVNLASVLNLLGMPWEALAVLDAAAALKVKYPVVGGLSTQAVASNARGHALLLLGRWKDAESPLRQAVKLAPQLAESNTNLAHALLCQGNARDAAKAFQAGMRRTPSKSDAEDVAVRESDESNPGLGEAPRAQSPLRRPLRTLYDLTRGEAWDLPSIPFALDIEDALNLAPKYRQLEEQLRQQERELQDAIDALAPKVKRDIERSGHLAYSNGIAAATATLNFESEVRGLYKSMWKARRDFDARFEQARAERSQAMLQVEARAKAGRLGSLCDIRQAHKVEDEKFLEAVRTSFRGWEQATRRYVPVATRLQTGLSKNLPTVSERQLAMLADRAWALSHFHFVVTTVNDILGNLDLHSYELALPDCTVVPREVSLDEVIWPNFQGGDCPAGLMGKAFAASVKVVEVTVSCQGFRLAVTPPDGVALFTTSAEAIKGGTTLVFGIQGSSEQGKLGGTAASSRAEGLYLRWNKHGELEDVGVRIEGQASGALGLEEATPKFAVEFSVVSAVEYWTSDEYDNLPDD